MGQMADSRKNYGRISKYLGFHIWNILRLITFFGENSAFLKQLKEFAKFFVFIEAPQHTHFSLLTCAVAGCGHHQAMT